MECQPDTLGNLGGRRRSRSVKMPPAVVGGLSQIRLESLCFYLSKQRRARVAPMDRNLKNVFDAGRGTTLGSSERKANR
jgi:hypothetical protein